MKEHNIILKKGGVKLVKTLRDENKFGRKGEIRWKIVKGTIMDYRI